MRRRITRCAGFQSVAHFSHQTKILVGRGDSGQCHESINDLDVDQLVQLAGGEGLGQAVFGYVPELALDPG
jgi:hypothetical protein